MIPIKKHIALALGYFFLVTLLGVLLRLFWFADVPATFRYLLHSHSHLALLGWVYVGLTSTFYFLLLKKAKIDPLYRRIFWFTQITILGMLFTFPFQGYALFSIIFSSLFLIASYFYAWMVFKFTPAHFRSRYSYKCVKAGLIYMIVSSIGPWALGVIMSTLGSTSVWYKLAIYFYLHFQYNGWFILALCGFIFFVAEEKGVLLEKDARRFFYFINIAIVLTFFLSVLWTQPAEIFYNLAGLGAVIQIFAFLKFFGIIKQVWQDLQLKKFTRNLLKICGGVLVIKILLQLFSALPYFAELVYRTPDFVIGFLHLTFLGLISVALLAILYEGGLLRLPKVGFWLYFSAFFITEVLLFYRGTAIWQRWPLPEDFLIYLFAGSCLFPIGIGWIFFANLKATN